MKELEDKYQAAVLCVNCEQLRKEDVIRILEKILYEFPVRQIEYYIPKWVELLPITHYLKEDLLKQMKEQMGKMEYIRDIRQENLQMDSSYVKSITLEEINLSNGVVKVRIQIGDPYYYQVMSEMTGVTDRERVSADPHLKRTGTDETGVCKSPACDRIRPRNRLRGGDP